MGSEKDLKQLVDFAFKFCFRLIKPMQIKEEITEFLKIFKEKRPQYILEIGTAKGGTLFLFSKCAPDNAVIISVDLSGNLLEGGYSKLRIPLYKSFAKKNQRLYLLRKNSHDYTTFVIISKILHKNKLDVLYIDGDHSYNGVKKDFEMYGKLVKKGGIIVFHDIVPESLKTGCEVSRFWQEVKINHKTLEIVKNWKQNYCGIGIIYY